MRVRLKVGWTVVVAVPIVIDVDAADVIDVVLCSTGDGP